MIFVQGYQEQQMEKAQRGLSLVALAIVAGTVCSVAPPASRGRGKRFWTVTLESQGALAVLVPAVLPCGSGSSAATTTTNRATDIIVANCIHGPKQTSMQHKNSLMNWNN